MCLLESDGLLRYILFDSIKSVKSICSNYIQFPTKVWQISSAKSFDAEDWQLARTAFIKTKAQKILNFGGNVVLASAP